MGTRVKHLEILVEDPSTEAALRVLLPRILGPEISWNLISHQGKTDLLTHLPSRLRGYRRWLPDDFGIVVLLDADRRDCVQQKKELEEIARRTGLSTPSSMSQGGRVELLNRLAVEELEAWFFGDIDALCAAFPGVSDSLREKAAYRNPDRILGGTWEALERELQRAGYFRGGLGKLTAARIIAAKMEPARNRSASFQTFRSGILKLVRGFDLTSPEQIP